MSEITIQKETLDALSNLSTAPQSQEFINLYNQTIQTKLAQYGPGQEMVIAALMIMNNPPQILSATVGNKGLALHATREMLKRHSHLADADGTPGISTQRVAQGTGMQAILPPYMRDKNIIYDESLMSRLIDHSIGIGEVGMDHKQSEEFNVLLNSIKRSILGFNLSALRFIARFTDCADLVEGIPNLNQIVQYEVQDGRLIVQNTRWEDIDITEIAENLELRISKHDPKKKRIIAAANQTIHESGPYHTILTNYHSWKAINKREGELLMPDRLPQRLRIGMFIRAGRILCPEDVKLKEFPDDVQNIHECYQREEGKKTLNGVMGQTMSYFRSQTPVLVLARS